MIKRDFITMFVVLSVICLSLCNAQLIFPWFYPVQFAYTALGGAGMGAQFPDVEMMGAPYSVRVIPAAASSSDSAPAPSPETTTPLSAETKPVTGIIPTPPPDLRNSQSDKDVREVKKTGGIVMAANFRNGHNAKKNDLLKSSLLQFAKSDHM